MFYSMCRYVLNKHINLLYQYLCVTVQYILGSVFYAHLPARFGQVEFWSGRVDGYLLLCLHIIIN